MRLPLNMSIASRPRPKESVRLRPIQIPDDELLGADQLLDDFAFDDLMGRNDDPAASQGDLEASYDIGEFPEGREGSEGDPPFARPRRVRVPRGAAVPPLQPHLPGR